MQVFFSVFNLYSSESCCVNPMYTGRALRGLISEKSPINIVTKTEASNMVQK